MKFLRFERTPNGKLLSLFGIKILESTKDINELKINGGG